MSHTHTHTHTRTHIHANVYKHKTLCITLSLSLSLSLSRRHSITISFPLFLNTFRYNNPFSFSFSFPFPLPTLFLFYTLPPSLTSSSPAHSISPIYIFSPLRKAVLPSQASHYPVSLTGKMLYTGQYHGQSQDLIHVMSWHVSMSLF